MATYLKELDWYASLAQDLVDNPDNVRQREIWEKIDNMDECLVNIPKSIQDLDWVGPNAKFAVTLPHDIIQAIVRFLATKPPRIDGVPIHPDPEALKAMDEIESVLDWHYNLLNRRGRMPIRIEIARQLTKYSAVAINTQYIPYEVKRTDKGGNKIYSPAEIKQMKYYGNFNWISENVQNIYPVWSANRVLKRVVKTSVRTMWDMVEEFGEDNQAVKKALKSMNSAEATDLRSTYVSEFDYWDAYCRARWFTINGQDERLISDGEKKYELLRAEHKLDFIPWVITDLGEPLLKGIVDSGLYDHLALLRAIIASKALGQVADKDTVITTPNPENPNIVDDENNPVPERLIPTGTTIQRLPPHPIDQQILSVYQEFKAELVESAAARALVAIESYIGGNTPASSINAAQNTALAQLGLVQTALEYVHEEALHQALRWMNVSKEPMVGMRRNGIGNTPSLSAGAQFMLSPMGSDVTAPNALAVDPDLVYLKVTLQPTFIQDKQAAFNQAIIEQQAGVSRKTSLERAGIDNPEIESEQAMQEAYEQAMVQADISKIQGAAQLEVQQMGMQMQQQQMQQQASPQQQVRDMNGQAAYASSQGVDPRMGGAIPAQTVPNENRVSLNGATDTGEQLA